MILLCSPVHNYNLKCCQCLMLSTEIEDFSVVHIIFSERRFKYGILELGKYGIQMWT